ncbi:hypothetical protein WJX84_006821 [Apatococcus fuscideae]|uniref:Uncharacterized protein n=1 Tax=Apatococcus fuscideae TaxID=2026836 RepID=A0AAW1SN11_9CHLO
MEFLKSRLAGLSRIASSGLGASNTDECPLHVEEERLARAELALAQSEARRRLHCDPVELAKAVLDPHQNGLPYKPPAFSERLAGDQATAALAPTAASSETTDHPSSQGMIAEEGLKQDRAWKLKRRRSQQHIAGSSRGQDVEPESLEALKSISDTR